MRTLSRYWVLRFLGLFAAILFASTLIVSMVELLLNAGDLLGAEAPGGVGTYLLLRIPSQYLGFLIPISAFAAAFFCTGLAAHWLETVAMRSGGISPHRALGPLLCAAGILALLSFAINETFISAATSAWQRYDSGAGAAPAFRSGSFWVRTADTIYRVAEANRETGTLRDVDVLQRDERGRLRRRVRAERVVVEADGRWRCSGVVLWDFDPARPADAPRTQRYTETVLDVGGQDAPALMNADARNLDLVALADFIDVRRLRGDDVAHLRTALHSRISDPVALFLLTGVASLLGLRVEWSRNLGEPALQGVVALAAYYTMRSVGATLSAAGVVPAAIPPWSTLTLFGGVGVLLLGRIPR